MARSALRLVGGAVWAYWRTRLAEVTVADVTAIFDQIPDALMSDQGRIFRIKLLTHNQERIVDDQ